jgi:hypothetical protein
MIRRLLAVYRALFPKPVEWKPTGIRYTTERHYDYEKARAGYLKAQKQTESGRPIRAPRKAKRIPKDNVTPLRRQA